MGKGTKYDNKKPRTDLIPPSAIFSMAEVFRHGAKKYGDRNWEKGIEFSRLYAAIQRHLWAWYQGEDIDESGLNHLEHALTSLAMLNHMRYIHPEEDDRPKLDFDSGFLYIEREDAEKLEAEWNSVGGVINIDTNESVQRPKNKT